MEVTFHRGRQCLGSYDASGVALGVVTRAYLQMPKVGASWFTVTAGPYRYVGHETDFRRNVQDVVANINRAFGGSKEKAA